MHPLIARIHPALRTAFVAWLLSRLVIWLSTPSRAFELAGGAPLPGLLAGLVDTVPADLGGGRLLHDIVVFSPWIAVEAAFLVAGVCIYHFARATELPQLAERACWLWFFNPLLVVAAGDWGLQMAVATGAIATAALATDRPRSGAAAAIVATGCRLEFIILAPAFALAAWRRFRAGGHSPTTLTLSICAIPAAFTAWMATSIHMAGSTHICLRALHRDTEWRSSFAFWETASTPELVTATAIAVAVVASLRHVRRFPLWYSAAALPALLWPLVHQPSDLAAITTAWAVPVFVYFARATDDRSIERPLLCAFAVGFTAAAFGL